MEGTIRVLIVAGTPVMLAGVRNLLVDAPDIEVVGEALDRESLQAQLAQHTLDVVLVNLDPDLGMSCTEAAQVIKKIQPVSKVLVLSTAQTPDTIVACIKAGVDGYFPHGLEHEMLAEAIRDLVHYYGLVLPLNTALVIRERLVTEAATTLEVLTPRERQVLTEVAHERTNREIAEALNITSSTVRTHLNNIYRKLEVGSRPALIALAWRAGLGPTDEVNDQAEENDL